MALKSSFLKLMNSRFILNPGATNINMQNSRTIMLARTASRSRKDEQENCKDNGNQGKGHEIDLSFNDYKEAFKSKTFAELIRGYIVFLCCSSKYLVNHNEKFMKIGEKILGRKLFNILMKMTFYGHFVAGEDTEKIGSTIKRLEKYNVKAILDYAVEEDISSEEAQVREMEASTPKVIEEDPVKEEIGGKMPQYKPAKDFADRRKQVESARVYFYESEKACDRNTEAFLETLYATANAECPRIIAVKLTALGRPQVLYQLSEVIMRAREFVGQLTGSHSNGSVLQQKITFEELTKKLSTLGIEDVKKFTKDVVVDHEQVIHLFPWHGMLNEEKELNDLFRVPSLKEKRMVRLITQISEDEEETFRNMIKRLNRIIKAAQELDIHIMIDAEQTYFQPIISRITMEMMHAYNKSKATIMNTYQAYLKQTLSEICTDMEQAKRQNFHFGFKLVRGAYLQQERERAEELGYADPTNESFEATNEMYHKILVHCIQQIAANKQKNDLTKMIIMIASHNEDTVRHVLEEMDRNGVDADDGVIFFGQLLGMCDYITFPLGNAGYDSYKYVPYGPVHEVLPYLSRRAKENKSMLAKLKKEKRLLKKEIARRIVTGNIFYKP